MSSSFSSLTSTTCDCAQWCCCCCCCSHPCPWRLNEPGWKFLYANLWKTLQPTSAELLPLNHQSILLTDVRTNNEQKLVRNWHWKCRCRIHREKTSKKRKKFGHCLLYRNYTDRNSPYNSHECPLWYRFCGGLTRIIMIHNMYYAIAITITLHIIWDYENCNLNVDVMLRNITWWTICWGLITPNLSDNTQWLLFFSLFKRHYYTW